MKIVFREWAKEKISLVMLLVDFLARCLMILLGAEEMVVITNAVNDIQNYQIYITRFVVITALLIILSTTRSLFGQMGIHRAFTGMNNRYAQKMLRADYDMFTNLSCSRIITAGEQMWKIGAAARDLEMAMIAVVNVIIMVYEIYKILPVVVIPVVIVFGIGGIFMKFLYTKWYAMDSKSDEIRRKRNQELDEIINAFPEVRAYNTQGHHGESILDRNGKLYNLFRKRNGISAMISAAMTLIDGIAIVVVLYFVVNGVAGGTMEPATALLLATFTWKIVDPIETLIECVSDYSTNTSQSKEYDKVVNYPETENTGTIELDAFDTGIRVNNLGFAYNKSSKVLDSVNMFFKKGTFNAVVGPSGGGKSTLVKILMGYYLPTEGYVDIDGIDTRRLTPESVRAKIGVVHQDNHIFNASIYENVLYGNWGCKESDVIRACKKAGIYDFIQTLPEKFDTVVGPKGLKLSGGQKQRIALARVFLKDPEIIILDEATSSLDNESEKIVKDALKMFKRKTLIVIAHRLTTVKDADTVWVMKDHTIVEEGTHDELMKRHGEYYRLYTIVDQ